MIVAVAYATCPFGSGDDASADTPCPFSGKNRSVALSTRPNAGQKTFKGCECETSCGADIGDGFDCDWCFTKHGCGTPGLKGHHDYCDYRNVNATFEEMDAKSKTSSMWASITADENRAAAYPSLTSMFTESIQTSFDVMSDEMPNGRTKDIHTIGVVCQFDLDIAKDSPYTGLFAPGLQQGFIRMGSAVDQIANKGITPGLGIKFMRTGRHSGNYVALHSLELGQSWNFFAYNQSNHISEPKGAAKVLGKKFNQASQCAPQVGLSDMARFGQDGQEAHFLKTPFKLFLVPSEEVQLPAKEKTVDEANAELEAFPAGTVLYTAYACGKAAGTEAELTPTDGGLEKACADPTLLGQMVTTTKCTTSAYGDGKFQIRHQRIEEDWAAHPEFLTQYDAAKACGWPGKVSADGGPKTCLQKHGK